MFFNDPFLFFPLQRRARFVDCKLKAARARNAFILGAEAVSSTIHKYYESDLSEMIGVSFFLDFLFSI